MIDCKHEIVGSQYDTHQCCLCGESLIDIQAVQIRKLKENARYFIAEFEENWKEGRVSIDCKNACNGLKAELEKST